MESNHMNAEVNTVWHDASAHVAKFIAVGPGVPVGPDKIGRLVALTSGCCLLWEIMVGPGAKDLEPIKEAARTLRMVAMGAEIQ
jgi:hypothetical protein